jgi:hypothetical protein
MDFISSACGSKDQNKSSILQMASICFDINTHHAIVLFRLRLSLKAASYSLHDGAVELTFIQKFNRNAVGQRR